MFEMDYLQFVLQQIPNAENLVRNDNAQSSSDHTKSFD